MQRVSRTSRLVVPLSRASLLARTENRLTVTGSTVDVEIFKSNASGVSPRSLSFQPRGLLFGEAAAPPPLTFQRLLPVTQPVTDPDELLALWGSTTDALSPRLSDGRPRRKGRASAVFEFLTYGHAPLPWLAAAAASQPTLRFGLMWAQPDTMVASEVVFQDARLIHKSKMSHSSWLWDHKVAKEELFGQIKELLRFPDGRVPRKNKLKAADVEARLRQAGSYTQAIVLLAQHGWGAAAAEAEAARAASSDGALRRVKFFHRSVLPEFVAWLYWPERQQAKLGW
jgi:hypothetical protein